MENHRSVELKTNRMLWKRRPRLVGGKLVLKS